MLVQDIMTKDVVTIDAKTKANEIAALLMQYHIHGLPVVDEAKKLIGIVTETDFVLKNKAKAKLPEFASAMGQINSEIAPESVIYAEDIMTKECITIKPDASIDELMPLFTDKKFPTIPVVDSDGKLAGIVTIADVVKLFQ